MHTQDSPLTMRCGNFCYTLLAVAVDGETRYTVSATDGGDLRVSLEGFTDSACLAEAFLALLARNGVNPLQIPDVWEDMLT